MKIGTWRRESAWCRDTACVRQIVQIAILYLQRRPLADALAFGSHMHARHAEVACSSHASTAFCSSIATVIGPTPPGTGVIAATRSDADAKSTSPAKR